VGEDVTVVELDHFDLSSVGTGHLDLALRAARASAAEAGEMLVGIQADKEQALNLSAFQRLVALELLSHPRLVLAPVLRLHTLGGITKDLVMDRSFEAAEVTPAPPVLGLLGQVQVTGDARDHSQDQAQNQR